MCIRDRPVRDLERKAVVVTPEVLEAVRADEEDRLSHLQGDDVLDVPTVRRMVVLWLASIAREDASAPEREAVGECPAELERHEYRGSFR